MLLRRVKPVILLLVPVLVVGLLFFTSACGIVPTPHARHFPTTPQETAASQMADNVLQTLQRDGLPIGESFTFTANNDPDGLLGTGSQYIGKVTFKDTRLASDTSKAGITVVDGGCIEIFANMQDVQTTKNYIAQANQSGALFFTEYDYWRGIVLLRLSSQLTPDQARGYQDVLNTYQLQSAIN